MTRIIREVALWALLAALLLLGAAGILPIPAKAQTGLVTFIQNGGFDKSGRSADLSVTVASSSVALPTTSGETILLINTGSNTAYVQLGASTVAATTAAGIPLFPSTAMTLSRGGNTHVAAITSSSTTTVVVMRGSGVPVITSQVGAGGGGATSVNLTQVGGAAIALGQTTMSASLPVAIASNQGAVPASQSGTWTVQPGNTPNTSPWLVTPTPSSAAGTATTAASSSAAASNLVLKGSAGNLYDLTLTVGATSGYLMLFDATALPSNGAVTPVFCAVVTSNGTNGGISLAWPTPKRFGTGITAGFSTTGCFTLTASATGNFFGGYQ